MNFACDDIYFILKISEYFIAIYNEIKFLKFEKYVILWHLCVKMVFSNTMQNLFYGTKTLSLSYVTAISTDIVLVDFEAIKVDILNIVNL